MRAARVVEAPAKVNLLLRVLGRRPDGYHDIETLFQAISLADEVSVTLAAGEERGPRESSGAGGARLRSSGVGARDSAPATPRVELEVVGPDVGAPHENLAHRAARRFLEVSGHPGRVCIRLVKRIPAGAGLGGGSSDAAAVLRCLDELIGGIGPDGLHAIAAELGSDVPFFLGSSPLAVGRGRGERLTPVPALPPAHLVLALPPVHVSTAGAYGALAEARAASTSPPSRPPIVLEEVASSWAGIAAHAGNDFESVIAERHQEVRRSLEGMRDAGARWALLSGSGAASFGVFDRREEADAAARRLEGELGWSFVVASTLTEMPVPHVSVADVP